MLLTIAGDSLYASFITHNWVKLKLLPPLVKDFCLHMKRSGPLIQDHFTPNVRAVADEFAGVVSYQSA